MNKSILLFLLCLFISIGTLTAQTYSGGSGTEASPYLISSKADMAALATAVNANSSYSTGKYFLLTNDITEEVTTVIGKDGSYPFKGTFDGGGHRVKMKISGVPYAGVFGYASGATIKNLGVEGSVSSSSSSSYAGGICGSSTSSSITNCYNTGSVSSSSSSYSYPYAGGICGYASPSTTITNCIAANTTIVAKRGSSNNSTYAGRIVGDSNGTIQNCYALAAMQINGETRSSQDASSKDGKDFSGSITGKLIMFSSSTCSNTITSIFLDTSNPLKWQRSSDKGSSWTDISCTEMVYTETNPSAGHYIYRAQNGDGSFSPYVEVTYHDAVPATINTLPLIGTTKTVDEGIAFTLELEDDNYSYQWYKNDIVIAGATGNTFSIPVVKSADAGVYKCRVWNGCNETYSENSTLTVNKSPQVITFPEIPLTTYGDGAITLPATTDKGLTITYQSTNSRVATVEGNVLTPKDPGTCTIIASQAGNVDYLLASVVERTLTVNKQAQTINLGALPTKRYGEPSFTLPATTDKGLVISYQVINTQVATVSGNTVTILNAGTTDVIASQAGDEYRYAATPVTQKLTVQKANQSIQFANLETKTYGDPPIELNQYSDAGFEITYTSDNPEVATINGHTIVLRNAGSAQITAAQEGNSNFSAAPTITRTLMIGKAGQTIVWSNIPPKTYGDEDFYLPQTTNKGLNITYSVTDTDIATVTGNKVHIVKAGATTITASQAGSSNYFPASSVTLPLTVTKSQQSIDFSPFANYTYGDPAFSPNAVATSNLPIVFTSSDTEVATVSGNQITIVNAGTTYITATVAENDNYYNANPVSQLLTVKKAAQTITLDNIPDKTYGDATFVLKAEGNTGLPVTYASSDPSKLLILGNQATIFGAGSFTVTASQLGDRNYLPVSDKKTFVVKQANLTVTAENKERTYGDVNPVLTYTFSGFVNGDSKVDLQKLPVIISTAALTSSVGSYPIVVTGASDNNYQFAYQNAQLKVNKALLNVKPQDISRKYGESNPAFVLAYSGFKNNETQSVLLERPSAVTTAKATSNVGVYPIYISGGAAGNYELSYQEGQLSVEKALLNVVVDNKQRTYGDENPNLTYTVSGFKNSDTADDIDVLPVVVTYADMGSEAGLYAIEAGSASDNNYAFAYFEGNLQVDKAPLTITANDTIRKPDEKNPVFTLSYSGFKNNDDETVLDVLPEAMCLADDNSPIGFYDIVLLGGEDNNYSYTLVNGKLEVTSQNAIDKVESEKIRVYPNPASHYLYIRSDLRIQRIELYDLAGNIVLLETLDTDKVDVSKLSSGMYILNVYAENKVMREKVLVKR